MIEMKITKITCYNLKVPLLKPYKLSSVVGTVDNSESIIVKIETDNGLIGYGEADPLRSFTEETPETIVTIITHTLGPLLIGRNPLQIGEINKIMDDKLKGNLLAKGALDIALHDLSGKALDIPVSYFFGGPITKEVPLLWPIGSGLVNENVNEVKEKIKAGFNTFMIKTGELPLADDIARVHEINKICNESTTLVIDANQGWQVSTALEFIKKTSDCNITFIEQPVPSWNIEGLKEIKKKSKIPISVDESLTSIYEAGNIVLNSATDFFSIKVSKHGGLLKANKIIALAESMGIPCMINSMIELGISQAASLQLGLAQNNLVHSGQCFMSTLRISDDITNLRNYIKKGRISIPKGAGLGIEVNQSKINKYTVKNFEIS